MLHYFLSLWEFCFCKAKGPRALSLTTGLMPRIWRSHCPSMTSVSGQEPKLCFKQLQTRDQLFSILTSTKLQLCRGCISDNYSPKTIIVKYKKTENITDNDITTVQWKTKIQKKILKYSFSKSRKIYPPTPERKNKLGKMKLRAVGTEAAKNCLKRQRSSLRETDMTSHELVSGYNLGRV